jgi:hypothetical protein
LYISIIITIIITITSTSTIPSSPERLHSKMASLYNMYTQAFPPKARFTESRLSSLEGKVGTSPK